MEVLGPRPPRELFSCCAGYLAAYNSLIDGIFLSMLCYKMSLSSMSGKNWKFDDLIWENLGKF